MGTVHSSGSSENTKLSLADRRYRVSGARAAEVVRRRSTRKLGSVAVELKQPNEGAVEAGPSSSQLCQFGGGEEGEEEEDQGNWPDGQEEEPSPSREGGPRRMSRQFGHRRMENFQLTRTENAANATILLTRTQRVLIENCWKRAKKGAADGGIGARVFHAVIIAQPDIKFLFGLEKVPLGRLKYEGQFRRHAGLLNRALDYIIKNLQYTEKLDHHFQTLGKKHCQMNGGRAFPSHYWDTFLECITQGVLECDGASGGRQHRCRETAMAWRNLISFIVQQMRRGFEEERLQRKRFSASLMGLRGVGGSANAMNAAYGSGSERARPRAATGRPRPSIALQNHSHGSLGSLEMLSGPHSASTSTVSMSNPFHARARAASAISPLAMSQQSSKGSLGPAQSSKDDQFGHLMPQGGSPSSSSARSASWCAEVSGDQLRRLQINNEDLPTRTARSELNIDNETGEPFYTPRMTRNEKSSPARHAGMEQVPKPALAAVQLLLNAASVSEGQMLDVNRLTTTTGFLPSRHSVSAFSPSGSGGGVERESAEKAAAHEASNKLLGWAQSHLNVCEGEGDSSPTQPRRLSAL